jgi:hypothetical protein
MTDIVEELRLLQSGAQLACGQTAATLEQAADEIERLRAERDAAVMDADMQAREAGNVEHDARALMAERDSYKRNMEAMSELAQRYGAERDRLRHLLSLAEATLSEARLYIGYGNVGPLHNDATWHIIRSARAELKEAGRE